FLYLFDLRHLSAPAYYGGDALYYLQLIKNVTLFGTPYWGEVGAPFPPELWLFPGVTISWVIIMKTLALFPDDVFVITNSFALVVTILNGLAFYYVARNLGVRRPLAWLGGVAFAFVPFTISRALVHQVLLPMVAVPIGVYLSILTLYCPPRFFLAHAKSYRKLLRNWIPLLVLAAIIGISGHDWAASACLFIVAAGAIAACSLRRARPLGLASVLVAAIVAVFLTSQLPAIVAAGRTGAPLPPSARAPGDQVIY